MEQRKALNHIEYILHIGAILPNSCTRGHSVYFMPLDVSPECSEAENRRDYEHNQDNSLLRVDYVHLSRGGEPILKLASNVILVALETRASLSVYPAQLRWKSSTRATLNNIVVTPRICRSR